MTICPSCIPLALNRSFMVLPKPCHVTSIKIAYSSIKWNTTIIASALRVWRLGANLQVSLCNLSLPTGYQYKTLHSGGFCSILDGHCINSSTNLARN